MSDWRYIQNGQICGPVETTALRNQFNAGTLPLDTLVWTGGMPGWVPANTLPEFTGEAPVSGSPVSSATAGSTPPSNSQGPPPVTSDAADIEQNKVYAVLAYIGLLFLVPLLAAPQSRFARYHTNQGIVLFLATTIATFALIVPTLIPFVGCLTMPLMFAVAAASVVLMILGIINAASGQYKPLPWIGHYQLIK